MKRKIEDGMTQSAIWLPREWRERLKREGGERGMSEEIRRRLKASFDAEEAPDNPKTRELLDAISFAAGLTAFYYADWSKDPFSFEVLKRCVDFLVTDHRPKGEPVPKPTPWAAAIFDPDTSPNDVSRVIMHLWKSQMAKPAAEAEKRR
jgi:hypothetical protein